MDDLIAMLRTNDPEHTQLTISPQQFQNDGNHAENEIAVALQGNSHIETFHTRGCGPDVLCPIFRALASPESASLIKRIKYDAPNVDDDERSLIAEAIREYLASGTVSASSVQCLELRNVEFAFHSGASMILDGLSHNESVNELTFAQCTIGRFDPLWDDDDKEEEEEGGFWINEAEEIDMTRQAQKLAVILINKPGLTTLRILEGCNFLHQRSIVEAVCEILGRRRSSLQCFEMDLFQRSVEEGFMTSDDSVSHFQLLLEAVSGNSHLKCLLIRNVGSEYLYSVEVSISSLKVKELVVTFFEEPDEGYEERFLGAFEQNYAVQNVECKISDDNESNWFTDENQARLDVFLDRNRKLVQWTKDPKMVPRELWSYAIMLALKAGINSLFQSLLALSGQGVGLRDRGRKRKRTHQLYDPSSCK